MFLLMPILVLAFTLRVAWRVHTGSADFWENGYSFLYDLAKNVVAGKGLCLGAGACAIRTPLYPLFLALAALCGKSYLWIVIPQAIIGTATALCAFVIGAEFFGQTTGLLASILTAIYPYYVIHDTALQETSLFTFLTALSLILLFRARRSKSVMGWTFAGLALGAAVLTRPTIAPFVLAAFVWLGVFGEGPRGRRVYRVCAVLFPFILTVGSWLLRNYLVVGTPVLSSELGLYLWLGNNRVTFTHYPVESIDETARPAFAALTPAEQAQLNAISTSEVREDRWLLKKGIAYIRTHPFEILRGMGRKIAAGFSWNFNPRRPPLVQMMYLLSYGPILILGAIGMLLTHDRWKEHSLIYLLFLSFALVTAVFWAHTSHRSYLDVYLIVFSAYVLRIPLRSGFSMQFQSPQAKQSGETFGCHCFSVTLPVQAGPCGTASAPSKALV